MSDYSGLPAGEMAKVQDFLGLKRVVTEKHFYFNKTKGFPLLKEARRQQCPQVLRQRARVGLILALTRM